MIACDWRTLDATEMAPLYATETGRWLRELAWDSAPAWAAVELARTTWGLPGLVCVDVTGRVRGWTFYLPVEGRLDVGGFVSDSSDGTAILVDALIERAGSPQRLGGLVFATAADLASILASRDVFHQRYSYRLLRLDDAPSSPMAGGRQPLRLPGLLRDWSESDIDATSELLYESYAQNAGPIGPGATLHDWREYVTNLSRHGGCGTLSPVLSRVLTIDDVVAAATLVSTIAPQTAHLVQLAVRRAHQGAGLGHALLATAVEASRHAGFRAISLLVAQDNEGALRLYQQAGFVEQATFVALRASAELRTLNSELGTPKQVQPFLLTSVADEAVGTTTRR